MSAMQVLTVGIVTDPKQKPFTFQFVRGSEESLNWLITHLSEHPEHGNGKFVILDGPDFLRDNVYQNAGEFLDAASRTEGFLVVGE